MKVLHVIPSVSPVRGGTSTAVLGEVKALRELGIDAEIFTTNDDGPNLLDVPLEQKIEYQQVPVCFFPKLAVPIGAIWEFSFSQKFTISLWRHIQNYDLVEIHSLFSYTCTCAGAIARRKKMPYIFNAHGQFLSWVLNQKRLKKEIYAFLVEKSNLNKASGIRCTTSAEEQDVLNFGIQAPTFTVTLGIEPGLDVPNAGHELRELFQIPPEPPIILFFSRLHPKKRPDFLLEALAKIADEGYNFHCILAGSGEADYVASTVQLSASLGLKERTSFPGLITHQKALFMRGSDIFVLPSFAENFGMSVAEAMTVGLPVIVTPEVQIASDIAAANAGLIVPGEVGDWTEAIKKLLVSAEMRQQLGANGQRVARERYTWDSVAKNLVLAYSNILNGKKVKEGF